MALATSKADLKLGNTLARKGLLTQAQLEDCLLEQAEGKSLIKVLIEKKLVSEDEIGEILSEQYGLPYVNVLMFDIPPEILENVDEGTARKYHIIPVDRDEKSLTVALSDPNNMFLMQDLKIKTKMEIVAVLCLDHLIAEAIERFYKSNQAEQFLEELQDMEENVELVEKSAEDDENAEDESAPVVKWVNVTVQEAIKLKASDIHIEPEEKTVRLRYRLDGTLKEMKSPPKRMQAGIVSRIKIISGLDIAEKRKPQDGRFKMKHAGKSVDFRVSVLPTVHGEKVVMRLLDGSNLALDMSKLGFEASAMAKFEKAIHRPYGMVIVTGPTGSGKSTTLYSALSRINAPDINIVTVEDPVEFQVQGINQVQVNEPAGLTFAAALKSFLRQDPDVIMLGEIRDHETGSIAVKSALTGHLVLSTLHTNDAPSSINRLVDMGIEPFLISAALILVIAQRLARRICKECKISRPPTREELDALSIPPALRAKITHIFEGSGCPTCSDLGYKGRVALYEVMEMCDQLGEAVVKGMTNMEIKSIARSTGMQTLRESGINKLIEGVTTVKEVLGVTFEDEILSEGEES